MKAFIYFLMSLIGLILVVTFFKLDAANVFEGESIGPVIAILAALCAFLLLSILLISQKIEAKVKAKVKK